jgi:hypothetical protein
LAATSLAAGESFITIKTARFAEVLRGVSSMPGSGERGDDDGHSPDDSSCDDDHHHDNDGRHSPSTFGVGDQVSNSRLDA